MMLLFRVWSLELDALSLSLSLSQRFVPFVSFSLDVFDYLEESEIDEFLSRYARRK